MDYTQIFSTNTGLFAMFAIAFIGGLVASISPCSLSMLPVIVGYIGGYSDQPPIKTLLQMIFFIFGTAIVFSIIGIICAVTGKVFVSNPYFVMILASIIMIMGLKLVGILNFEIPVFIKQLPKSNSYNVYLYPIILGGAFALVGTPCSTPILAGIMAFASLSANIFAAVVMLFLFSLGQGLILVIAGFVTSGLKKWNKFYEVSEIIMKVCGLLLILASLYIFYKIFIPLIVI